MLSALIIYEKNEVERNRRFIDYWLETAKAKRVDLRLVTTDQLSYGIWDEKPFLMLDNAPVHCDFVVMRAKKPLLGYHLERMGIPVFNNARVGEILNDKRKTHALLQNHFPMMPTAFIEDDQKSPFPFPVVVKSAGGCGGREVKLCADEQSYREAIALFKYSAVVQPLCDMPGRDVRVYMLGKDILQTMLRYSVNDDFRANFGIHRSAKPIDIPDDIRRMAHEAAEIFDFGLVGVDFIFHKGRALFNEAEDVVGTRMLYQYTDIDIVPVYMDFILRKIGHL